jgi:hypothetical protein
LGARNTFATRPWTCPSGCATLLRIHYTRNMSRSPHIVATRLPGGHGGFSSYPSAGCEVPEIISGGLACRAEPDHRKMSWVDGEAEVGDGPSPEVGKEPVRNLDLDFTLSTDQVAMRRGREVIGRGPVPKMGVHYNAKALELLEVPVNGRNRDVGCPSLDLGSELLRGSMPRRLEQATDEKAPRCGHAISGRAETGKNLLFLVSRRARDESG